jgi:hypothetical protein
MSQNNSLSPAAMVLIAILFAAVIAGVVYLIYTAYYTPSVATSSDQAVDQAATAQQAAAAQAAAAQAAAAQAAAAQAAAAQAAAAQQAVAASAPDYTTPWSCVGGINVPIQLNKAGDVQCASTDGKNCLWNDSGCNLANVPASPNPLACGSAHNNLYGMTGYNDKNHWCNQGFRALQQGGVPPYPSGFAI